MTNNCSGISPLNSLLPRLDLSPADLATLNAGLEPEKEQLRRYVSGFLSNCPEQDSMYVLKLEHSLRVLENAQEIGREEAAAITRPNGRGQASALLPLLALAALYHDLGRFEQLRRFGTFRDADSINHGQLGAQLLRERRFLGVLDKLAAFRGLEHDLEHSQGSGQGNGLGHKSGYNLGRGLVRLAVLLHNRNALPASLAPELVPFCQALREADQLDILGIMERELRPGHSPDPTVALALEDLPQAYSPAILKAVLQDRPVIYSEMRYVNDFRCLLCTWPGQMRFAASLRILKRRGHIPGLLSGLPENAVFEPLRQKMFNFLENV